MAVIACITPQQQAARAGASGAATHLQKIMVRPSLKLRDASASRTASLVAADEPLSRMTWDGGRGGGGGRACVTTQR
jgi:hypothetical protein